MSRLLATTLEKEISRLARTELHKALAGLQAEVNALRKQLAAQERRLARGAKGGAAPVAARVRTQDQDGLDPATIRQTRKRLGISQVQLAKLTSVTPVAVYFWEAGRTVPQGRRREILLELRKMKGPSEVESRLAAVGAPSKGKGRKKASRKRSARPAARGRAKRRARKAPARKK